MDYTKTKCIGELDYVLFPKQTKPETDYYILKLYVPEFKKKIVVKGLFPGLQPYKGARIEVHGKFEFNDKYKSWEFNVSKYKEVSPDTKEGLVKYITSLVQGLGYKTVKNLVEEYGLDLIKILDQSPELLEDSEILSENKRYDLIEAWKINRSFHNLSIFLQTYNIPTNSIKKIYNIFKDGSERVIRTNPYLLVDICGSPFSLVDTIAKDLNFSLNCEERIRANILQVLKDSCFKGGHLYITVGKLKSGIKKFFSSQKIEPYYLTNPILLNQLTLLAAEGKIFKEDLKDKTLIYPKFNHRAELESAQKIRQLLNLESPFTSKEINSWVDSYEKEYGVTFTKKQRDALLSMATSRVLIITGNPGTGKSFLVKALVQFFKEKGLKNALLAPTGIAAKKLNQLTGEDSGTIHRTLRWDGNDSDRDPEYDFIWGFNHIHPYPADVFIIDEISMIDQFVFYHLLDAIPDQSFLIMIGDSDQLPSVGAGNVLGDLVESNAIHVTKLTEILRQEDTSEIILLSHKLNKGEFPSLKEMHSKSDVVFISEKDDLLVLNKIKKFISQLKDKDIQLISPMYRSDIGVDRLNAEAREIINPPSADNEEIDLQGFSLRVGDKVVVTKNNYEKIVFNGEEGIVRYFDKENKKIFIWITDANKEIEFSFSEAREYLKLSYCLTIHKVQGNEYDIILLPISKTFGRMLYRKLLYTAITRAKKKVIIFGDQNAFNEAINNNEVHQRNTLLSKRLSPI